MKKSIVVTIAGLSIIAATGCAGVAAASDKVAPAAQAVSPAVSPLVSPAPAAPVPAIKDSDPALKYQQAGKVVTITRKSAKVATVTLVSADYAAKSTKVVLSVKAARPFTINPVMFTLYDAEGWENDPTQTKPVKFAAGTGSLTLTFTKTPARAMALGWVPQNGEAAVAVWER